MENSLKTQWQITGLHTDRYDTLKPSALLHLVQEAAGEHCKQLHVSYGELQQKNLFWAIIRHRVQICRWPQKGERITLETWPMPTTRTAFPRSVTAWDENGQELFHSISLWVLMDTQSRSLVLPKKSGVEVPGFLTGTELAIPGSAAPGHFPALQQRQVSFCDLDVNGHMNNTRYLDWVDDLLPSAFHSQRSPRNILLHYHSEAREGDRLDIHWQLQENGTLQAEMTRPQGENAHRIFSVQIEYT